MVFRRYINMTESMLNEYRPESGRRVAAAAAKGPHLVADWRGFVGPPARRPLPIAHSLF